MKREKYYCDICKREIIVGLNCNISINGRRYYFLRSDYRGIVEEVDLCKKCQKNLVKFVKSNIENDE